MFSDSFVKILQKHLYSEQSTGCHQTHYVRWPTQPFCWPRHVWWSQWCLGPWGNELAKCSRHQQSIKRDTVRDSEYSLLAWFPKKNNMLDDQKVETCKNCRNWSFLMCASLAALINDLPSMCFVGIQIHPLKKSLDLRWNMRFSDIECPADCVAAIYNVLSRRRESSCVRS